MIFFFVHGYADVCNFKLWKPIKKKVKKKDQGSFFSHQL